MSLWDAAILPWIDRQQHLHAHTHTHAQEMQEQAHTSTAALVLLKKPEQAIHEEETEPWLAMSVASVEYENFAQLIAKSGANVSHAR